MAKRGYSELLRHVYEITDDFENVIWRIIVNKILYYYPDMFSGWEPVSDAAYDGFEKYYLFLCTEFGLPNEFVHKEYPEYPGMASGMMEVDFEHPMVKEILAFMKDCHK